MYACMGAPTMQVTMFEGSYSEYEADRRTRLGSGAATPHRLKFRKLAAV
jgi:energy-dependent translational throttle protein EttA